MANLPLNKPVSSLRRLVQQASRHAAATQEHCDLCSEPLRPSHRHLLDLSTREIACACRPCSILFDQQGTGHATYRVIPDRRAALEQFHITDAQWDRMRIPVGLAFFLRSRAQHVTVYYPSPMGPTESLLETDAWAALEQRNPELSNLEPEVEALLVNRARGARQYFIAPVDDCYRLVGIVRLHWKGLSGGQEVWKEIERFFGALRLRATRSADPT